MPLLSIIVPIYNVEKYLTKCIESVLSQSLNDYELILVDDGSPDNCGCICDQYSGLDSRIRVIHKKNGGLSDARNAGLKIAKGKYIIFLDSDDYMKEESLSDAMGLLMDNDVDLLICPIIKTYLDGKLVVDMLPINKLVEILSRDNMYSRLTLSPTTFWGAGKNIYKNNLIKDNKIEFKKNLIGAEDCEFFMEFVRTSETHLLYNSPLVHYRLGREGSITTTMSYLAILGQLEVFQMNHNIYKNYHHYDKRMITFFSNKYANTITLIEKIRNKKELEQLIKFIGEHKNALKNTKGIKYLCAKLVWKLFGYHVGTKLLRLINPY